MTAPAVTTFLNAVNDNHWRTRTERRRGVIWQQYYGDERGDGTRPQLYREVGCLTESIRLSGPGHTRAAAMWQSLDDGQTWTPAGAWVWKRHPDRDVAATWLAPIPVLDLRALVGLKWAA